MGDTNIGLLSHVEGDFSFEKSSNHAGEGRIHTVWLLDRCIAYSSSYLGNIVRSGCLSTSHTSHTRAVVVDSYPAHRLTRAAISRAGMALWQRCRSHQQSKAVHRARLVLGLATTFGGSTIPVFIQAHSDWSSLRG